MTGDKALDIFLMLFFAFSGILILILAFIQPMGGLDRILTILIGSAGILGVLVRTLVLKSAHVRTDTSPGLVNIRSRDKS